MKKIILAAVVLLSLISCKKESNEQVEKPTEAYSEGEKVTEKTPEALGKEIFEGKGNCFTCHQMDQKVIGPSIKEIAQIYKDKNASIIDFLKEKSEPIVDPSQFAVMQTNFGITKAMSDEELKAIETYFYSTLK